MTIQEDREPGRFVAAQKLSPDAYKGPVFWPGGPGSPASQDGFNGAGFFANVADLIASCAADGEDLPEYVWACDIDVPSSDADNIIRDGLEGHYEGAGDHITVEHRAALDAFLRQWWADSGVVTWRPDYSRAVVLGAATDAGAP